MHTVPAGFEEWQPLYPGFQRSLLPGLESSLAQAVASQEWAAWLSNVQPLAPGVYPFPLLRTEIGRALNEEVVALESFAAERDLSLERPNSMNRYGVILDAFGYAPALQELVAQVIQPLAARLFPGVGGATLDQHHGFVVDYSADTDRDLSYHADDSEVTLNLCLGEHFTGGDLYFRGRRCFGHMQDAPLREECFDYAHVPGTGILHAGLHRHGAYPIQSGARRNLILWCRSSRYRAKGNGRNDCAPWCGVAERQRARRART